MLTETHGGKAGRMLAGFAELPDGAFVWTRQLDGAYRLGRIGGSWRYDDSPAARAGGIPHVRPAVWSPGHFEPTDVPDAVAKTFARGGRNLQRIRDPTVQPETLAVWRRR